MRIKQVCSIGLLCLVTACSSSSKPMAVSSPVAALMPTSRPSPMIVPSSRPNPYPVLPLPPGAIVFGPTSRGADPEVIILEITSSITLPFTLEGYTMLLGRYGWISTMRGCERLGQATLTPTETDTTFLGVYTYAPDEHTPFICLSKDAMIEAPYVRLTLSVYQCGALYRASLREEPSYAGCQVIIEPKN